MPISRSRNGKLVRPQHHSGQRKKVGKTATERANEIKRRLARKRKHRKQNCWCSGWPWCMKGGPHRMGSKASYDYTKRTGATGCNYEATGEIRGTARRTFGRSRADDRRVEEECA